MMMGNDRGIERVFRERKARDGNEIMGQGFEVTNIVRVMLPY